MKPTSTSTRRRRVGRYLHEEFTSHKGKFEIAAAEAFYGDWEFEVKE